MVRPKRPIEELVREVIEREYERVFGKPPKFGSRRWRQEQMRAKERAEAEKAAREAELDAADQALLELFSDPKGHAPRGRRYNYDPERREFIQDAFDFAIEQAITGKPRRPRRIRLPKD